jgi:sugar/nucleoside kinase (ribokinase family)
VTDREDSPALVGLFVGHVTHDRFGRETVAGGSAWFAAQTWRRLGGAARLVTTVGADFRADAEAFAGVAADVRREGRTTVFHNRYEGSGPRVQWIEAAAPPVTADRLPAAWRGGDVAVAFLAPVFGEVDAAAWARATGARVVALGVQGWLKTAGPLVPGEGAARRVVPRVWTPSPAELDGVTVAVLSDDDLRGQGDLLATLRAAVPLVALTHGRDGATLFERHRTTALAAFPTTEVDPTGAGDTFAAGLLFGLAAGRDPVEAARLGAAAASIIVEAQGGRALGRMAAAPERVAGVALG